MVTGHVIQFCLHLHICDADIINEYLQDPSSQKHYNCFGPYFGLDSVGKKDIIRRVCMLVSLKDNNIDNRWINVIKHSLEIND